MDISKIFNDEKLNPSSSHPLYQQIADILAQKIRRNILPAGSKLPPERNLAQLFDVSRTTAINAYRHLEQEGLIVTKIGSGTYVAGTSDSSTNIAQPMPWNQLFSPHLKNPLSSILRSLVSNPLQGNTISLAAGMPDPAMYPMDILKDLLTENIKHAEHKDFGHIPTEGYQPLRSSIASWQTHKGIQTTSNNVLIVSGSQQGLYLISKVLIEPGDYVIVEAPTYIGAIQTFQAAGARILCLPSYQDSADSWFALLEDYLIRYRPKLFYIIPNFQNPTGHILPLTARKKLLELVARHYLILVEDDPYGELYYTQAPPPPLKVLDNYGGVIYLGTFSKILFPGLRTGWLTAPPIVINRLAQEKQYIDLHSNNLTQWLLHLFLKEGHLDEHLARIRPEYQKRRDAMANSIKRFCGNDITFTLPEGGFYLWCKIQRQVTAQTLLRESVKSGLSFVPGEAFYAIQSGNNEIRLCFTTHPAPILSEGIKRLAITLKNIPDDTSNELFTAFTIGRPII